MVTTLGIGRVIDSQVLQSKIADIGAAVDGHTQFGATGTITPKTIATTPVTLAVAEFVNGVIDVTVANSTTALTTPTAAAIVAAIPGCQVGTLFEVHLMNLGSGTLTWTLGTGITGKTTNDVTTVATNKGQTYMCVVTNVTAGAEAIKIQQDGFATV